MELEILTPTKKYFQGRVGMVQVPGSLGLFSIYKNHAPIISTLEKGTVKYVTNERKEEKLEINGGVVEVKNNKVIILLDNI